jgi:hypothetical protein
MIDELTQKLSQRVWRLGKFLLAFSFKAKRFGVGFGPFFAPFRAIPLPLFFEAEEENSGERES